MEKWQTVIIRPSLVISGIRHVDHVFHQYRDMSIKSGKRTTRGSFAVLEIKIYGPQILIPKHLLRSLTMGVSPMITKAWETF